VISRRWQHAGIQDKEILLSYVLSWRGQPPFGIGANAAVFAVFDDFLVLPGALPQNQITSSR
jgi:hypothetical protein